MKKCGYNNITFVLILALFEFGVSTGFAMNTMKLENECKKLKQPVESVSRLNIMRNKLEVGCRCNTFVKVKVIAE